MAAKAQHRDAAGAAEGRPLNVDPAERPLRQPAAEPGRTRHSMRRIRRRRFSPLTRRILFLNSLALVLLAVGLLYLDDYRRSLIESQFSALATQGQIIAAALGEAALDTPVQGLATAEGGDPPPHDQLAPELVRQILRRLAEPTQVRARLYALSGELVADTRVLGRAGGTVEVSPLAPPSPPDGAFSRFANAAYDFVLDLLPTGKPLPRYREQPDNRASDYEETAAALGGELARALRADAGGQLVLSIAVPVQRFKRVLGALQLTVEGHLIEDSLRSVRFDIIKVFLLALAVTILISIYLASTIARPIRRLALAAERVRRGHGIGAGQRLGASARGQPVIPDMRRRGDEIGDLSVALNEMTRELWQRLDAIERFAADVAHEIKNPLTSLKSAVETAARLKDPEQQRRLMSIIVDDVARLDRLIGDISGASRLDAELSRSETEPVDITRLLSALIDVYATTATADGPRLVLDPSGRGSLIVPGIEDRLGQVFRNLIANAISFSPPRGTIRLRAMRRGDGVEVAIEDEGPGIPEDRLEAIFDRFYSERPKGEKFGTHSGLGLSISRQIVNAHGGRIWAENRHDPRGGVLGARFSLVLPVE